MNPPNKLRSGRPAGSPMVTSTLAVPPAGTLTLGALKATVASAWPNWTVKVFGPVASAGRCARS